ncbi:myb-like protein P [Phymastichus coffea]|uniref:myb-like protein P n=1 Tax=Phymastichus coffea TaxID=108790 RepID=UPI00273C6861|nr:myb-like protein P [Phymastichus coffea]
MALRGRSGKDVKKSSYYVWYLGAREAKGVDAMPGAIDYLLERERLQEPFKVTLQVSSKGLKIIQTIHPGGSTRSAVKQLVPGHVVLAAVLREDIVAAALLLPNPATNNPVHVHAYRCDSVETAELLGGQLKILASHSDSLARLGSLDTRLRSNLGSDGRSTRESESSEGSAELRHIAPIQSTSIYESLAAELRAKLGRGTDNDAGPILLPPRDYDTVHRHRGNLTGIELRRCLNQTIVGQNGATTTTTTTTANGNSVVVGAGTRSAASSGIGSDSAATPPPYQGHHHPLGPRPTRPTRDSSSDEDWGAAVEEPDYLIDREPTSVSLPRLPRSPERVIAPASPLIKPIRGTSPITNNNNKNNNNNNNNNNVNNRMRKSAELRQRSPSPQYQPRLAPGESPTSPRERFHDAKEMFRQMEREAIITRPIVAKINGRTDNRPVHRSEPVSRQSSQSHEEPPVQAQHVQRPSRQQQFVNHHQPLTASASQQQLHERLIRRGAMPHHHVPPAPLDEDVDDYRSRSRPTRATHYQSSPDRPIQAQDSDRPRPRSFYEVPMAARELRGPRNPIDAREVREYIRGPPGFMREKPQLQLQQRPRPFTYGELTDTERYPGLDRENARPALEIGANLTPARYRHSYAEPARLGLAALHPY